MVGYTRVSTREQGESKLGLHAQEAAIRAMAAKLGLPLGGIFTDVVSGRARLDKRPGLADALNAIRRGDTLLVAKRDRLARDAFMAVLIEREVAKNGCRIVSAGGEGTESDEPAAVFTRRILDAVSELERSLIAARTRAALAQKRAAGYRVSGHLPYGYRLDGNDHRRLQPDQNEQRTLARLRELRAQGLSYRAVADQLNLEGYRVRSGRSWKPQYAWSRAHRR